MKEISPSGFRFWQFGILIAGIVLSCLYINNSILTIDHFSMLDRGYAALVDHQWSSAGNPGSGGFGGSPGYLSTAVVAIPLMIHESVYAPFVFLMCIQLLGYLLLDNIVKKVFASAHLRSWCAILYWLSPWLLTQTTIWNPSYMFFFGALHLWTAVKMHESLSFPYTFLHVLCIGLAAQLHLSAVVLMFISILLLYKRQVRVNWSALFLASGLIVASLLPYLFQVLQSPALIYDTQAADGYYFGRSIIHVYPLLKSVLYWLKYGSFLFSADVIFHADFGWLTPGSIVQWVAATGWKAVMVCVGLVTLTVSVIVNWKCYKSLPGPVWHRDSWLPESNSHQYKTMIAGYCLCSVVSVFIGAMISPFTLGAWHLVVLFPAALMPLMLYMDKHGRTGKVQSWIYSQKHMVTVIAFLVLVNLVAAHDSKRFSFKVDYRQQVLNHINSGTD